MFQLLKVVERSGRTLGVGFRGWRKLSCNPCLLRDFLQEALYAEDVGYFSKHARIGVGGGGDSPRIEFPSLFDQAHYMEHLAETYKQGEGSWLTPVEIFKPWYGMAIAQYILRHYMPGKGPLHIVEIGGGSGTCMVDVTEYIRDANQSLFSSAKYTIVEISPRLATVQEQSAERGCLEAENYEIINLDCLQVSSVLSDSQNAFVIALEVLDNLPHDKVVFDEDGQPWQCEIYSRDAQVPQGFKSMEEIVGSSSEPDDPSRKYQELYRKAHDSKILNCLNIMSLAGKKIGEDKGKAAAEHESWLAWLSDFYQKCLGQRRSKDGRFSILGAPIASYAVHRKTGIVYLPTSQIQFLEMLRRCIPSHRLILSDFDVIPGVVMHGANGPAVQVTTKGSIEEVSNYLIPALGSADIYFPTDFWGLKYAYERIVGKTANILGPAEFFGEFEDVVKGTTTHSGYNPLLQDYVNTSILVTDHSPGHKS